MPDLILHPADARLRGETTLFSARTWAGWILGSSPRMTNLRSRQSVN